MKMRRLGSGMLALLLGLTAEAARATTYYLSSSRGRDEAAGSSESTAWRTLERASDAVLSAGDRILLRAGDRFAGTLRLDSRGEQGNEVVIAAYGEGEAPVIDGRGAEACIQLLNPGHVVVRGLELTNGKGRYGIRMTARGVGGLGTVTIEDLDVHGVYQEAWSQPEDSGHGEYKYYGGINAQVLRGKRPSWWDGIVIRGCRIHDLGTCGISIGSAYSLHEKLRARRQLDAFPILGVRIEGNVVRDVARDGAIIRQCEGAVVQHNEVVRTGRTSISNGLWFWDCRRSVIRYNEGRECGVRGRVDGSPFSVDYYCSDCVIEYNYSHDNEGPGFMAFGNHGTGKGTVIRGNVSYNDATADSRRGFAAVSMVSALSETVVEGNTVIAGPGTRVLMGHHDWQGLPVEVTYRANVFVGNGRAPVERSVLDGGRFEGNLFVNVPGLPEDLGAGEGDAARAFVKAMARMRDARSRSGTAGAP